MKNYLKQIMLIISELSILSMLFFAFSFLLSCNNRNNKMEWLATTPDAVWQTEDVRNIEFVNEKADVVIDITNQLQTIDGFGACFNEMGWTSLSLLSDADREKIFYELFEYGKGANFTVCRMPIGANDFSRDWYSYNETDGDFEMMDFSIANDQETLIPFIKTARKYNSNIKIWASPWSPPSWMKYNHHYACRPDPQVNDLEGNPRTDLEGTNMFIQEEKYLKSYSLYFGKFIDAYRQQGIDIFMVAPQNEFNSCQNFPSCTWTASGLARFMGYLGPEMKKRGVELMFGTMERSNSALADTILNNSEAGPYIKSAGFQWAGKGAIGDIHKRYPLLKIYQTEQECGNGRNDWRGFVYSWGLMLHYFNNGTNVYNYWNISLEEGGISRWGWRQNSLITVNKNDRTYQFTYEYYLMKHVSHFVLPGARLLPVSGEFTDLLAFQNADGSYVLVIHNANKTEIKPVIRIGNRSMSFTIKPESINTIKL